MMRWPADVKARALDLYVERGPEFAASETGVPAATVRSWAHRSGVTAKRVASVAAHVEAAAMRWAERRGVMVEQIGEAADLALQQCANAAGAGKGRDAQAFATTMAILVDKAQLLSGDATSRHETTDPRRRMAAVRDELAERRDRGAA